MFITTQGAFHENVKKENRNYRPTKPFVPHGKALSASMHYR